MLGNLPSIIVHFTSRSILALDAQLFLPSTNNELLGFDDACLRLDGEVFTLVNEVASLLLQHAGSDWSTFCFVRVGEEGIPAGRCWQQSWAVLAIDLLVCWCWRNVLALESNGTVHNLMNFPVVFLGFASSCVFANNTEVFGVTKLLLLFDLETESNRIDSLLSSVNSCASYRLEVTLSESSTISCMWVAEHRSWCRVRR